jgi:hypothetical protein
MTDLTTFSVPCYNAKDGCTSIINYQAEPGSRPLRKICPTCMAVGAPSERSGLFSRTPKGRGDIPKHFMEYGAEPLYQVTVWPKASFFTGGRVSNHA